MNIVKYPMKTKTEKPLFNYLIRMNSGMDYYLYEDFDTTIRKAMILSILVYTFFSRMFDLMLHPVMKHSTTAV